MPDFREREKVEEDLWEEERLLTNNE